LENLTEQQEEFQAVMERFEKEYIRQSEGEVKKTMTDQQFNGELNQLVKDYATGAMADQEFTARKFRILDSVREKYPDALGQGKLTIDNFLEAARNFRHEYQHGNRMAELDINLKIDLGVAKQAIKTEANRNFVDKAISAIQKNRVGAAVLDPTAFGFGVSIAAYLAKKPLAWVGGAAGVGLVIGMARKNAQLKKDVAMNRSERAMGIGKDAYGSDAKRREKMEEFTYASRSVSDIRIRMQDLQQQMRDHPEARDANREAMLTEIADIEARMSLNEERNIDTISFEGETQLERGRLFLLKELAEQKLALGVDNAALKTRIDKRCEELLGQEGGIDEIDSKFRWFKAKEVAVAGAIGAISGLVVGSAAQYGIHKASEALGFGSPGGRISQAEQAWEKTKSLLGWTAGEGAPSGPKTMGELVNDPDFPGVDDEQGKYTLDVKTDPTTDIQYDNTTGIWTVVDKDTQEVLGKFDVNPDTGSVELFENPGGLMLDRDIQELVIDRAGTAPPGEAKPEAGLTGLWHKITRAGWYTQDTPTKYDYNEQRLLYGGPRNAGFTEKGFEFDLSHLKEGESWVSKNGERVTPNYENLKIMITPDAAHPGETIMVDIDPTTKHALLTDKALVEKLFAHGAANGKTQFMGRYIEIAEVMDEKNADGTDKVRILATVPGPGKAVIDLPPPGPRSHNQLKKLPMGFSGLSQLQQNKSGRRPLCRSFRGISWNP
jgi:hypothetical protein